MRFFLGIVFTLCLAELTLGDKKSSSLTNGAPEDPARKLKKLKTKQPMATATPVVPKKSKSPKVPVGKKPVAPKKSKSPKVPLAPKKSKSPKVPVGKKPVAPKK